MLYIKILDGESVVSAEALENPVYVCRQASNNYIVRCPDVHAQGILSSDGSAVYQLYGRPSLNIGDLYTAYEIAMTEYEEIINSLTPEEDSEDTDPDIPDGTDPEEILTRAELTAYVRELQEANIAKDERIEMLEDCILEMSEVVYADD